MAEIYPYELKKKHRAQVDKIQETLLSSVHSMESMLNEAYWQGVKDTNEKWERGHGGDAA